MENIWNILVGVFNWVAQASMYAAAVTIIIFLIQTLGRRYLPARWSYALWMILLLRMILPAGPQSRFSLWNLAPQWATRSGVSSLLQFDNEPDAVSPDTADFILPVAQMGTAQPTAADPARIQTDRGSGKPVSPVGDSNGTGVLQRALNLAPFAWLIGVLSLIIGISVSNLRLWRSVRRQRLITDQALLELFEDCRQQLRVRTMVGLVETDRVKSPSLFGFLRPRVLLPKGLPQQVRPEELRYIFLHELAHLKRGDIWIGWIVAFLQSLHWFNPLVWWAFARMRFDRELACDASVLGCVPDGESRRYGETLIGMLEHFSYSRHLPAVAGILESGTQLKRRLTMITKFRPSTRLARIWAVILIAVLSGAMLTEAGSDAGKTGISADELAVEQTLTDMLDAMNRSDFDRWEEFYVQGDSFSISGFLREPVLGFERYKNILKQFRNGGTVEEDRSFSDIKVHVSGDTAWATLRDQFVRKLPDSRRQKVDYYDVFTLSKRDGRWLINNISQTEQNVKYVLRYTIHFSNGSGLETYLPSHLSKSYTGGFALQDVFTQIVDPVYPEAAKAAGVSGEVVFLVTFDEDGYIIGALRRLGDPILADAAATAMLQWKANPMPVSVTFPIKFVFHPDGSVDTAQTTPTLGTGSFKQNELAPYPGGFPKPEDFLIGEPPDGLATFTEEAMPMFVRPTEIP